MHCQWHARILLFDFHFFNPSSPPAATRRSPISKFGFEFAIKTMVFATHATPEDESFWCPIIPLIPVFRGANLSNVERFI
jgi:hypothetical protein